MSYARPSARVCVWLVIFATIILSLNAWSGDSTSQTGATNSAGANPPPAISAATEPKDYPLPDLGTLHLDVPKGWSDSFNSTTMLDTPVDTVQFVPRDHHGDYVVLIQAIHMKPGAADNFDVKTNLANVAQHELGNSVELLPDIHDLKSPRMEGAWFRLDRPARFRHEPKARRLQKPPHARATPR